MKLLSYSWVKNYLRDNCISQDKAEQSFGLGATYRGVLAEYIKRELHTLDKESRIGTLSDKPDRAELLLMYQAQREVLNNFLEYIIDNS